MNERKVADCRKMGGTCSVVIEGTKEEVMPLAVHHAVTSHGHADSPETWTMIENGLANA